MKPATNSFDRKALKRMIQDRGSTQVWVADQIGVTKAMVTWWLNGKHVPGDVHLLKLAQLFNTKIKNFIKRKV